MHVVIEKARKAAGIGSLKKNYPESHKERGCGFWAAFIGVVGDQLAQMDAQQLADQRLIAELANEKADLENQLAKALKGRVMNGIEALSHSEGWTKDKQSVVMAKIAG